MLSPKSGTINKACNDSQFQVHSKKLKSVESGKVKFLPAEEAIRLSLGSQKMGSSQRINFGLKWGSSNTVLPRSRRTPIPSKISGAQINSMMNDQAANMSKQSKGKAIHVAEPKKFAVVERDLQNMRLKYEQHRRYLPALESTWSGGFEFFDSATPGKFYGGIQAQPPSRLHPIALEFAQRMPKVVQVKLLPRCEFWADLFGNDFPDYCDISLYFFPADNIERSEQNIFCLFELLESNDSLMRSYIDGLELLIFSSKQLQEDSQRIIARKNTEFFLWGIFRLVKSDQILHKGHEELPSLVSPKECAFDYAKTENFDAIDMDVDMEGGRIVGTVDLVVSKDLPRSTCGINGKIDVDSAAEKMLLEQKPNFFDSSTKFTEKIQQKFVFEHPMQSCRGKLANAKNDIGVSPGFKEKSCKKEPEVVPFSDEHANSVTRGHAEDRNRCREPYLVEVKTESKMDVPVHWSPPPKDWVKLNIEGSSIWHLGCAGAGGIVRNEFGKWLLGYTETLGNCSSLTAELNALYQGLKLVWEKGFRKILVESASLEVVKCLEQAPASLDPNRDLIESCRDLLKRNWECKVKQSHREANLCANWLAAHAECQPLGTLTIFKNPPWGLIPIFHDDCTGTTQAHVS
ncbi:hypothetical protein Pint_16241 [Pistacia integerrima]|uniref:Uncharacterized protein n=1 Tax=Pistacia integerrima TaxID=434235 RepID=A0ACC0ZBN9_9ROSI|nr:hypothetical protein Pint_16241 [Pistacia integerrima]